MQQKPGWSHHGAVTSRIVLCQTIPMSSSYRAQAMAGRVVITHDMPDATVISELDVEQADVLLQQLQIAVRTVLRELATRPSPSGLPPLAAAELNSQA